MWDRFQKKVTGLFTAGLTGATALPSRTGKTKQTLYTSFRREVQREHDVATTTALRFALFDISTPNNFSVL